MSGGKTKVSNLKEGSAEQILIAALKSSATHQETQNKATNERIDNLYETMVSLVDEIKLLVAAGIRREESDKRNTERGDRLEKTQTKMAEKLDVVEKQVLLLRADYDNTKDEKEKDDKNRDHRKNNIISGLAIAFVLAAFALIAPYL